MMPTSKGVGLFFILPEIIKVQMSYKEYTPKEFYKKLRPENYSDSKTIYKLRLPKEHLAYEIESVSVNQKQDQFENLARRISEKFIAPNLIPQVGPTGGGDGKTDSETHPVSKTISSKWYTPEMGWKENEYWAFAISSKEDWKGKLRSDVKNIISTDRGYTKIFFISNRKISSKKKKDTQDKYTDEFKIDIIILDGEWLIEKIINNDLYELVVDSLGLSSVYKEKDVLHGSKDAIRKEKLINLEEDIKNPNRYFETDFQLVEDCLYSAILSRELEENKDITIGKFDRALKFAKQLGNENQICRVIYERAWTSIFWYNDFDLFIDDFITLRELITYDSNIHSIELYQTLTTLVRSHEELHARADFTKSITKLHNDLKTIISSKHSKTISLRAETLLNLSLLFENFKNQNKCNPIFKKLNAIISEAENYLGYPFESTFKSIKVFGEHFPLSKEYDLLLDAVVRVKQKRDSDYSISQTLIPRAIDKMKAGLYEDTIVILGRVIIRLSKDESREDLIFCLNLLGRCYTSIGLLFAANVCLTAATSLSLNSWFHKGYISKSTYNNSIELAKNEILIGRIPPLLSICELINVIHKQVTITEDDSFENEIQFIDSALANRLMHYEQYSEEFQLIPDLLKDLELEFAADAITYQLGYEEEIIKSVNNNSFGSDELKTFMQNLANQPISDQFHNKSQLLAGNELSFQTKVLGLQIEVLFDKAVNSYLVAEAILSIFESFLSTSLNDIVPMVEKLDIRLHHNTSEQTLKFDNKIGAEVIDVYLNTDNFFRKENRDEMWSSVFSLLTKLLTEHFAIPEPNLYLKRLFEDEEVTHRVSFAFNHAVFSRDLFGASRKLYFDDWHDPKNHKQYLNKRIEPLNLKILVKDKVKEKIKKGNDYFEKVPHNKRTVSSIIKSHLWDKAKWKGFGYILDQKNNLGVILLFENKEYGQKVFDDFIYKFGNEDIKDFIRISLITKINTAQPNWYRVHICGKLPEITGHQEVFVSASRFHEMNASTSTNLLTLMKLYKEKGIYTLYPAFLDHRGRISPDWERGIRKKEIVFKEAWRISLNDIDSSVIKSDDQIIIPQEVNNPPIYEVLKQKADRQ